MGRGFLVLTWLCAMAGCQTRSTERSAIGPFVRVVQPVGPDLRITSCEIVYVREETTDWFDFFFSSHGSKSIELDLSDQQCQEKLVGERWMP